jgi:hypothetical protein
MVNPRPQPVHRPGPPQLSRLLLCGQCQSALGVLTVAAVIVGAVRLRRPTLVECKRCGAEQHVRPLGRPALDSGAAAAQNRD